MNKGMGSLKDDQQSTLSMSLGICSKLKKNLRKSPPCLAITENEKKFWSLSSEGGKVMHLVNYSQYKCSSDSITSIQTTFRPRVWSIKITSDPLENQTFLRKTLPSKLTMKMKYQEESSLSIEKLFPADLKQS